MEDDDTDASPKEPSPVGEPSLAGKIHKSRSRKERPCDKCRFKKVRCYLEAPGLPCALCKSEGFPCTFDQGPQPRRRNAEPVAQTLLAPAQPVQTGSAIGDNTLIYYNGSAEHIGDTTFYEELQGDDEAFPTFRNVNLNTEPHASRPFPTHRTNQTTNKVLSVTQLSTEELLNAVKPHGRALIDTYFKIVWPIFPGPSRDQIMVFLDDPLAHTDAFTPLAPLLACMIITGSHYFSVNPVLKGKKCPDTASLRDYVRKSIYMDLRMPQLVTCFAFVLKYHFFAYDSVSNNFETWSAIGALVSAAQNLGLHEDPADWHVLPWEKRLRKRLWWQIYCMEKFTAHGLGRASLIHEDSYNVPPLAAEDHEEVGGGEHAIYMSRLALVASDILSSLFSPRGRKQRALDFGTTLKVATGLMERAVDWYRSLPLHLAMNAPLTPEGLSSNGFLHLTYFAIKISLYKALLKVAPEGETEIRAGALQLMQETVRWARTLTVDHIRGVWPTYSAHHFCHISSFMLALLFTSIGEEEFHNTLAVVRMWRQSLSVHSATCFELVSSGLVKIDRFADKGVDSLVGMWQRKSQLAFYHPSTFGDGMPSLEAYVSPQPRNESYYSSPVAPSMASFYAPALNDPPDYTDRSYIYNMPPSQSAQILPPRQHGPHLAHPMPLMAPPPPHGYGHHPIMAPNQSFFWSDNGQQFWTTEDHVHAGFMPLTAPPDAKSD